MNAYSKERIATFYEQLLNEDLPKRNKKRCKISSDDFTMLNYNDYNELIINEYNLSQLKLINRNYKQKISGNKSQLLNRLYNYLKYSFYCLKIQKIWRGYLQRQYNKFHGPAFFKRDLCVNDTDFFTLESCHNIPFTQFFSFQDDCNFIYGFDILSIYNLYLKSEKQINNPYTKKELDRSILQNLKNIIKYSKILKISLEMKLESDEYLENYKKFDMRILSLFQYMDTLGNYTNIEWFKSLDKPALMRFIRELYDIWMYRAQLDQNIKREICPPLGNPFHYLNLNNLSSLSFITLQKSILYILEQFVKSGINRDSKVLGTMYVLSALTLVNENAAEALPWLYLSVIPS